MSQCRIIGLRITVLKYYRKLSNIWSVQLLPKSLWHTTKARCRMQATLKRIKAQTNL